MKRVLVTGSSSGFGRALVSELLARGHQVFAGLRKADARANIFTQEQADHGERLCLLELDVTSDRDRAAVASRIEVLDVLVNNAGAALFGAFEDTSEAQLRGQLEVNFTGTALLSKALLPALRASRGALINVSSVFGYAAFPLTSGYCASKYALEGLSEALYHELRPHGVRVHLVEPGGHRTGFSAAASWAEGRTAAYASQTRAYHALRARLSARTGRPPSQVATRIAELVERPSSRLRVPVGPDAQVAALVKRLPDRLATVACGALYDRLFLRQGSA